MKLTAFDLSLTGTGWARWDDGVLSYGTLEPPKKKSRGMERLDWIRRQCFELATGATFAIMEEQAYAAHDRNHERAGLTFLVRHKLWMNGVAWLTVAPMTLKKYITGSGKGKNKSIILHKVVQLAEKLGDAIEPQNDNESDALVLLYIGLMLAGVQAPLTKAQEDSLKTVSKNVNNAIVLPDIMKAVHGAKHDTTTSSQSTVYRHQRSRVRLRPQSALAQEQVQKPARASRKA